MEKKKCIFDDELICQEIEFCDNCPTFYDWAVYFIFQKENKKEAKNENKTKKSQ